MGGSILAQDIWDLVRNYVPLEKRKQVALEIYDRFCAEDADDWDGESQLEIDADINQDNTDYDEFEDNEYDDDFEKEL